MPRHTRQVRDPCVDTERAWDEAHDHYHDKRPIKSEHTLRFWPPRAAVCPRVYRACAVDDCCYYCFGPWHDTRFVRRPAASVVAGPRARAFAHTLYPRPPRLAAPPRTGSVQSDTAPPLWSCGPCNDSTRYARDWPLYAWTTWNEHGRRTGPRLAAARGPWPTVARRGYGIYSIGDGVRIALPTLDVRLVYCTCSCYQKTRVCVERKVVAPLLCCTKRGDERSLLGVSRKLGTKRSQFVSRSRHYVPSSSSAYAVHSSQRCMDNKEGRVSIQCLFQLLKIPKISPSARC